MSKVTLQRCRGRDGLLSWVRRDEDYVADFYLVSKRTLDAFHYGVFVSHFLLGEDWRLCCTRLKIDRGTFFHAVYRLESRLGRVFRELEPYGLYPLDEYFRGRTQIGDEDQREPCARAEINLTGALYS